MLPHFSHIFPHKSAFSTAVLILFVFLFQFLLGFVTSTMIVNRMAPSTCPDPCATSWFQAAYFRIFPPHIWRLCDPHIFNKNAA